MDIAIALRTILFLTGSQYNTMYSYKDPERRQEWVAHLQAGAGIVADSNPDDELKECENKAAALSRAFDLAESTFVEKFTSDRKEVVNGSDLLGRKINDPYGRRLPGQAMIGIEGRGNSHMGEHGMARLLISSVTTTLRNAKGCSHGTTTAHVSRIGTAQYYDKTEVYGF
ncbi:hypothetical protein ZIOFF_022244 [Zingiber officinale]|uniref:Uncharacterized protein n=1 Tax=Zingiber officinale TaxID=94328 RepID=A0A8J5LK14_ZINOF|nr:hypothetical protein ZIOFF_022244 [Zingiber officinale]